MGAQNLRVTIHASDVKPFHVHDPISRDITRKRYPEIERERDKRATVVHNVACEGQEMTFLTICCTNINMW